MDPILASAITSVVTALLLWLQTWFLEKRRRIETKMAREEQAEANAKRVMEKLAEPARMHYKIDADATLDPERTK